LEDSAGLSGPGSGNESHAALRRLPEGQPPSSSLPALADFAAWPHAQLYHRLLDALDLHLSLLDVHLDAIAQRFGARLAQGFLHAAQRLLFGAVGSFSSSVDCVVPLGERCAEPS